MNLHALLGNERNSGIKDRHFFLASPVSLPSGKKLMPHGSRKIKLVAVYPILLLKKQGRCSYLAYLAVRIV